MTALNPQSEVVDNPNAVSSTVSVADLSDVSRVCSGLRDSKITSAMIKQPATTKAQFSVERRNNHSNNSMLKG